MFFLFFFEGCSHVLQVSDLLLASRNAPDHFIPIVLVISQVFVLVVDPLSGLFDFNGVTPVLDNFVFVYFFSFFVVNLDALLFTLDHLFDLQLYDPFEHHVHELFPRLLVHLSCDSPLRRVVLMLFRVVVIVLGLHDFAVFGVAHVPLEVFVVEERD